MQINMDLLLKGTKVRTEDNVTQERMSVEKPLPRGEPVCERE